MNLIKCMPEDAARIIEFYARVVEYLENHTNYPKWSKEHPSEQSIMEAIEKGTQYAYIKNDKLLGAVVLNEDPEGYYEDGNWTLALKPGEFCVIHVLAVDPDVTAEGIGGFIVDDCVELARQNGYRAVRLDVVPGNIPADRLYQKKGFRYAGTRDLRRNIEGIPVFQLYERILL